MKAWSPILVCMLTLGGISATGAQAAAESELYLLLRSNDSLLFDAAFTRCDPGALEALLTEDFEFYHDRGGVTRGREAFLQPFTKECEARPPHRPQPSRRILMDGSLQVFPLYDQGVLYGAVQEGAHRFEFLNEKGEYQKGDIARFTHLWLLEQGHWKIKRVLSYDHRPSDPSHQSSSN